MLAALAEHWEKVHGRTKTWINTTEVLNRRAALPGCILSNSFQRQRSKITQNAPENDFNIVSLTQRNALRNDVGGLQGRWDPDNWVPFITTHSIKKSNIGREPVQTSNTSLQSSVLRQRRTARHNNRLDEAMITPTTKLHGYKTWELPHTATATQEHVQIAKLKPSKSINDMKAHVSEIGWTVVESRSKRRGRRL
jgi:hypothetical protein